MTTEYVLIFHSAHRVLKAEAILERAQASARVVQVPRRLTSDCGLAVRFDEDAREAVVAALKAADHLPEEAHRREAQGFRRVDLFAD